MVENKVCFISCVTDEDLYKKCLKCVERLLIPDGFEVEKIAIRDAKSMTEGYNRGMNESDAKYKVYLHQDVYIINQSFISDTLALFSQQDTIGILGVCGAKELPKNGIWWESDQLFGCVIDSHTRKMALLQFQDVLSDFELVETLDGLILVTQYDIHWRADLFDGFHFYDVSQCMEFTRAGYSAAVPKQERPWVVHDCGLKDNWRESYEQNREKFLSEYEKELVVMKSKNQKKKFILYMPDINDGYFTRDFVLIPFVLQKHLGYEAEIIAEIGEDNYPNNEKYTRMKVTIISEKDELQQRISLADVLMVFGIYEHNLPIIKAYKQKNPQGKVYCKLDMNEIWLMRISQNSFEWSKQYWNLCDIITVESRRLQNLIKMYWKIKIEYIPNGYYNFWDDSFIDYTGKSNIILTVGRPGDYVKNTDLVLNAFINVHSQIPDWKLVIVGQFESNFEKLLHKVIQKFPALTERINLTGHLNKEEVRKQFKEAKVFCHTPRWEGSPNVLGESLGGGCYPILTDFNSAAELIKYGEYGTIIPVEDQLALEESLLKVCNNEQLIREISVKVLEHAKTDINWVTLCRKIDKWLAND